MATHDGYYQVNYGWGEERREGKQWRRLGVDLHSVRQVRRIRSVEALSWVSINTMLLNQTHHSLP